MVALALLGLGLRLNLGAQETVVYSEGFETDNGGYGVAGTASWEWGTPTLVGPSSAHSGAKCWGTLLNGGLNGAKEGFLTSAPIAIPSLTASQVARVSFYCYMDIPAMQNKGEFLVSCDGLTWQSLVSFYEQSGGGWNRYECDVSSYAGGNIHLKFRLYLVAGYPVAPGMYIDDIAITTYTKSGATKTLTLEANEDLTSSCPWIYSWNGTNFVRDNDIYSTARMAAGEYRDFYVLQQPLVASAGQYPMEIRETESEESWTDFVQLRAVDHAADTLIAPDQNGNVFAYRPASLIAPVTAQSSVGADVLSLVNTKDGSGYAAYSQEYVDVDFGSADISQGAILILRVKGFMDGVGEYKPVIGPPAIVVQVLGANGQYQEMGRLLPRFEASECAFNLAAALPDANGKISVRLRSISHGVKYHLIDFVALATGTEPEKQITDLPLDSATYALQDVKSKLTTADNDYVYLTTGNQFSLAFATAPQTLPKRDFIFVSEGYYIPHGSTYFIYTWNGSAWTMRDSFGFPLSDATKTFDLSLFLPDPDGDYKVRIWQNQVESMAAIDYVGFSVGATAGVLQTAVNLQSGGDISSLVQASDDSKLNYSYTGLRNRWTAYSWTGLVVNHPPAATSVTFNGSAISWSYSDADSDPQSSAQVQIWTGADGSGDIIWNPDVLTGSATTLAFDGPALTPGQTYYARAKAFDGTSWGVWANAVAYTAPTKPTSTTTVSSSLNPSYYGQMVTFTATVTSSGGTPDGTVTFQDGAMTIDTVTLSGSGIASLEVSNLDAGIHSITAVYAGSSGFGASSGFISQTVNKADATVTLSDLSHVYDGAAKSASASTTVSNLTINLTYNGSVSAPVNAGSYTVVATVADANYAGGVTNTLVIAKALASVELGNLNQTYSGTARSVSNSTIPSGLMVSVTYDGSDTAPTSAGSYLVVTTIGNGNYAGSSTNTLTIGKATLQVSAEPKTRIYGDANPTLTVSYSGFVNGQDASVLSGASALSTAADGSSPVGNHVITAGQGSLSAANYTFSFVNGTLAITPKALLVTGNNTNRLYGATNPAFTARFSGFVNSEDVSVLGGTLDVTSSAESGSAVGPYPIVPAGLTSTNYDITYVNGTLTVNAATLAVTVNNQSRLYGAANPALIGTLSGVLNGDDVTATYATAATSASAVGTYDISPVFSDPAGKLRNYTMTTNLGTLTITKAALIVTADNHTRAYGQPNPTLTMSYSGLVGDDTAASLTTTPGCETTATEISLLGSYPIMPSGATSGNYTISYVNGTLTVTKAPLLVLGDNASRPYGQTNPVFTAVTTGVMNGDNISARFSTTADLLSPPEEYKIALNIDDPNGKLGQYNVTLKSGTLTVTPGELIGTVTSVSRTYGQPNPAFAVTYSGLMNGEDTSVLRNALAFSCLNTNGTVTTTNSPVGSYPIEVIGGQTAANYTVQYVPGTMTVNKAELIVAANNATRVYGAANPTLTGTLLGVQNNDNVTASFASVATAASNVGNFDIRPSFDDPAAKLSNYSITTNLGTLNVTQAALAVTVDNQTRLYGQANPVLTGSLTGVLNGDNLGVSYATVAGLLNPVGTYSITAGFSDPDGKLANYNISNNPGTMTVTPAMLTGTVDNMSRSYGETNPDFTVTYAGFVNAERSDFVTGALTFSCLDTNGASVDTNSPVGVYPVLITASQSAPNYSISYVGGELTVTQAVLSVTADNKGRAFGEANPPFTAVISGYKNAENATNLLGELVFACTADATSPIGDYAITPSGLTAANYSITCLSGALTVGKAVIVVSVDPQTRTYGNANPNLTATYTGFVNGEDATVLSGAPVLTTIADVSSPVGNYAITAARGSLSATNYAFSFVDGSLAVARKALTITGDDASRLYGAANPTFTASYSDFANGEDVAALGGTLTVTSSAQLGSSVGNYAIVPAGLTAANYAIAFVNGTLTVNPAALSVTADNQSRIYGATNPTLTGMLHGVVNSDNITATYTTAVRPASSVGTYDITPLFSDPDGKLGNYAVTTSLGTLTITKAALIVTADNQSRAYGQPNPPLTMSYSGFVSGDTAASLATVPSCATTATEASTLGGYAIVPAGAASVNYTLSYVNGTLMVNKASLLVLGDNTSRPYGEANPGFTAVITGIMNGDNITPIFSTDATAASVPRRYDIEIWLNDPDSKLGQYDVTMIGGRLTVTRAALVGTVQNQTRVYGQDNTPFSVRYSGFANGQDASILTGSLSYSCQNAGAPVNSGSQVGEYAISVATGQTAANYTIQYFNGSLTITPAALTVTGNDTSRVYGAANPTLTASFGGFVNHEDASALVGTLVLNTTATAASPVGSYPVTPGGLTSANYAIAYVDGALSITSAALAAKVDEVSRGYGDTNPVFTVSYRGFVNGDDSNVVRQPLRFRCVDTYDVDVDTNAPVGVYPIQIVAEQSASNYNISFADGSLTVTPAVLIVAADNQSRLYGAANPEFTATLSGFKNDEDIAVLGGELQFVCLADVISPVGTYEIEPSGLESLNYAVAFTNGTMTVGKVTVVATADHHSRAYGEVNPELTISYSGFVDGEDANVLETVPVVSTIAAATSAVGEYPITLTGGSAANYDLTLVDGTLTIGRTTIVATADNKSRAYGEANPQLTISYTGFANNEDSTVLDTLPTTATTANAASPIGDYAITLSGGVDGNYHITLVNSTLAIGKAALTITANPASRSYGQANPAFTGSVTGLVNSDPIGASYDSAATPTSPVGTYSIVTTLVDAAGISSNYNVTLVNGALTVTADDPPVVSLTQSPSFYTIGTEAVLVDTNAIVTDGGSLNFDGGLLTITVVTNAAAEDRLELALEGSGTGQIGMLGSEVTLGGESFATITGGHGTNSLVFSFNTNATPIVVQTLLRRLSFSTFDIETASRTIGVVLTDGDGGVCVPALRVLDLNRPPVANDESISASEGVNVIIPASLVLANDTDADNDTITILDYSAVTANGGRVSFDGTNFTYRAPVGFVGDDLFAYLIEDGRGGDSVGILAINTVPLNRLALDLSNVDSAGPDAGVRLQMGGIPGGNYRFETSPDLANWTLLTNTVASPAGFLEVIDRDAKDHPTRFYRAIRQ